MVPVCGLKTEEAQTSNQVELVTSQQQVSHACIVCMGLTLGAGKNKQVNYGGGVDGDGVGRVGI